MDASSTGFKRFINSFMHIKNALQVPAITQTDV